MRTCSDEKSSPRASTERFRPFHVTFVRSFLKQLLKNWMYVMRTLDRCLQPAGAHHQRNCCADPIFALEFYIKLQGLRSAFRIGEREFFWASILSAQESKKALLRHASPVWFPLATVLSDDGKHFWATQKFHSQLCWSGAWSSTQVTCIFDLRAKGSRLVDSL